MQRSAGAHWGRHTRAYMFIGNTKNLVGLDIGSSAVKVVELQPGNDGKYRLTGFGMETLPPEAIVDGAIISKLPVADAIGRIFQQKKIRSRRIATSLSGHSVIVKKITVPLQSADELDESIQWEAEQYIPFEITDVHMDYHVLKRNPSSGNMDLVLVAVKKDRIADQTGVVSMAGRIPMVIDVDAFALQNAYEFNYEPGPETVAALLDIGASTMTLSVVSGRDFVFARDITLGASHYNDFLKREMEAAPDHAERLKRGHFADDTERARAEKVLRTVSEILSLEIQKTIDYCKATTTSLSIKKLYLAGGGAHTAGLMERLQEKLKLPVEFFDSFRAIQPPQGINRQQLNAVAPDMAVAVGLALRRGRERARKDAA